MDDLKARKEQLKILKREVRELEKSLLVGQCFKRTSNGNMSYIKIISSVDNNGTKVNYVRIPIASNYIKLEYIKSAYSVDLLKSCVKVDENVFTHYLQELMQSFPALRTILERKQAES